MMALWTHLYLKWEMIYKSYTVFIGMEFLSYVRPLLRDGRYKLSLFSLGASITARFEILFLN